MKTPVSKLEKWYKSQTKPRRALWLTLHDGKAQLDKESKAKAAKLAQKTVARRIAPRKRIAPMSERMKARNAEYRKVRDAFLRDHLFCEACCRIDELPNNHNLHHATDVHHKQGRVGNLLTDASRFYAVCREAHVWIDANRDKARELGLLCKRGDWNKQPKD